MSLFGLNLQEQVLVYLMFQFISFLQKAKGNNSIEIANLFQWFFNEQSHELRKLQYLFQTLIAFGRAYVVSMKLHEQALQKIKMENPYLINFITIENDMLATFAKFV